MSDSPVAKKLKIEESEATNGEAITTNGTDIDSVEKKENNSNNHQTTDPVVPEKKEGSPVEENNNTPNSTNNVVVTTPNNSNNNESTNHAEGTPAPASPAVPAPAPAAQPPTSAAQATAQANRIDPNEIIAQLKESLRQEEAKLQFLRKLKLTQAKLKERQEKFAASNQTKEENKETVATTTLPPPPPLLKPEQQPQQQQQQQAQAQQQLASARCTSSPSNAKAKPFSVIVSNSQTIKPKPEPQSSLASSLASLSSITTPGVGQTNNMHRTGVSLQPNRAAMAKILEEMILQQPSPKPKVLQWPICPNINDQEYLHYTGLEFIVDRLKNPSRIDMIAPSVDITCVVCGLDFSPEWEKTDFEDKFECYYCFTSKLRKQVREEHTERLKQGFIKVVQKEKEFERQLQIQQREEQLMQQKLAEQQRAQQQQIMEQQQRTLQLQLQQQTLEQLQRQQIANQLLQHLQKSRQQPGTNSALNTLLQDPTNQLLAQLQKRGQQAGGALNILQNNSSNNTSTSSEQGTEKTGATATDNGQSGQLREYLLDLLPRLPTQ